MNTATANPETASPAESSGGQGELSHNLRRDAKMTSRAIRERWPISDAQRKEIVEWLMLILCASDDDRAKVNAGKALIDADKLNVREEEIAAGVPSGNFSVNIVLPGGVRLNEASNDDIDRRIAELEERARHPGPSGNGVVKSGAGAAASSLVPSRSVENR